MAAYYTNLKQYDKALEYTKLYVKLNDSIRNNDVQTQFKTIEEKYNKANNEKQIALLQKDQIIKNEKLKQQRFWLVLSGLVILFISLGVWMFMYRNRMRQKMQEVELRNQLAADLHDEVGSSLSSIYMLSQMAAQQQFENKQSILDKVAANAHETMDKMSDIVWMLKPNDEAYGIGLLERMENFASDLCASKNIQHTFQVTGMDSVKLSMQQSKNLYLIFKEAVNNAIKYSNTSVLDIVIHAKQKKLEMTIKDEELVFRYRSKRRQWSPQHEK
ncbi:MAG: histidine kinase [Flavobacteriaceae bacterium]